MKKIKYIALTAAAAALTLTSCSESFLDKLPDERTEIDNEDTVDKLLITSYPAGNYAWICELSSDNIMDNNSPHLPSSPNVEQVVTHYNLQPYDRVDEEMYRFEPAKSGTGQDTPDFLWETYYSAIQQASMALDAIDEIAAENRAKGVGEDGMTETLKASKGEAHLIRAFSHFILVNVFSQAYKDENASRNDAGVPYVTQAEDKVIHEYSRGTVTDTYAKIEADLEEGLRYVSDRNYKMPKWRFNQNAANAFAARFYLYKHDWEKVIYYANLVLGEDPAALPSLLMKYDKFDQCTSSSDYAKEWQNPEYFNNLMLMDTQSLIFRHGLGNRFALNSTVVKDIFYHNCPLWSSWIVNPTAYVSGMTFWTGEDYGYCSGKVAEEFEYTDKIAGIGYVHTIKREFTTNELLLERAEAKIMLADYAGALEDMAAYLASNQSFSDANKVFWGRNNGMSPLTESIINTYYANASNPNCFENWDFVTNMSASYVIPAEAVPYMNCLNDFRRFETVWDGLRFFDLKRWGVAYEHTYGPMNDTFRLEWDDPRRAIELPQDALIAGLQPSQPTTVVADDDSKRATTLPREDKYIYLK